MKKILILALSAICMLGIQSCHTSKQVSTQPIMSSTTNPFSETYPLPGFEPDTEEYFAATGIAEGPKQRMDVLQQAALNNAQGIIRQKIHHAYKGMVSDYTNYMGMGSNSSAAIKMERGGDQIIDAIINDTQARSVNFSGVDEKGHVTCFVSIRISKQQMAKQIAEGLSKDEELKLRFNEDEYRKRMDERFRKYKEEQ